MSDRLTAALEAFVRQVFGQRLDFLAAYPSKAVQQNADGTLELVPDDARLPTYKKVPIRYGVPGVTATIVAGGRVLLEFAGGDPQKPIATVWESASVTALNLGGTSGLQGVGLGANLRTELDALWAAIYGGHTHILTIAAAVGAGGTGTAAPAAGSPSTQTVTSSIVKVKP